VWWQKAWAADSGKAAGSGAKILTASGVAQRNAAAAAAAAKSKVEMQKELAEQRNPDAGGGSHGVLGAISRKEDWKAQAKAAAKANGAALTTNGAQKSNGAATGGAE